MGRSKLIKFKKYEAPMERHDRRKRENLAHCEVLEQFCREHGIEFKITNEGHHWQFRKDATLVEWWPSSAKIVINKRWHQGIHTHDWEQAKKVLCRTFKIEICQT